MRNMMVVLFVLALSGCASVVKVESGERKVGERMMVKIDGAWNHINAPGMGPAETWTMEGITIDQLILYSSIKDGQMVHAEGGGQSGKQKSFSFRADMQPDEIVAMFEGMLTRDGSNFKLTKLEPAGFGSGKGFRFEYALTRKVDNVLLTGVGYGAVSKQELFAILYMAPRLTFYARHAGRVEKIAQSALIKE